MNDLYRLTIKNKAGNILITRYYNSKSSFDRFHMSIVKKYTRGNNSNGNTVLVEKTTVNWKQVK